MAGQQQQAQSKPPPQGKPGEQPKNDPVMDLQQYLLSRQKHLADLADGMIKGEQMVKIAMLATRKNPALLRCKFDSLFSALCYLAECGIEPDGVEGALVPYKDEVQAQIMFKGYCKLLYSSGMVKDVYADVFFENELAQGHYRYRKGSKPFIHHEPLLKDRGEVAGAYCVIHTTNGGVLIDQMSVEDIERIRAFSKATYAGNPWATHWNEQAKKTVLKRCAKTAPQSKQLRAVGRMEGEEIEGEIISSEEMPRGTAGVKAAAAKALAPPAPKERIETPADRETVPAQSAPDQDEGGLQHDVPDEEELAEARAREAEEARRR